MNSKDEPQAQPNPAVAQLQPYQPGTPIAAVTRKHNLPAEDIVKLASNENPLGMGEAAKQAIAAAVSEAHRYPEQFDLVQALAAHHCLDTNQIVLGNGSNDVIDLVARAYLSPGDEAIVSQYAFAMYGIAIQAAGANIITVPARDFGHDLAAMRAAITERTKIIWIANPNNPTGTFIPYDDIQQFIELVPPSVLVVLDEAYYDYLKVGDQANTPRWLADYPNLVLARTFSKVYGLAGLRIGYGLANAQIIGLLNRVRQPFNANHLALAAAVAALNDQAFVQRSYNLNSQQRDKLLDELKQLGFKTLPAYGNFITIQIAGALQAYQKLEAKGVIVRPLGGYDMAEWLRVTVGLPEENQRFVQALRELHTFSI